MEIVEYFHIKVWFNLLQLRFHIYVMENSNTSTPLTVRTNQRYSLDMDRFPGLEDDAQRRIPSLQFHLPTWCSCGPIADRSPPLDLDASMSTTSDEIMTYSGEFDNILMFQITIYFLSKFIIILTFQK